MKTKIFTSEKRKHDSRSCGAQNEKTADTSVKKREENILEIRNLSVRFDTPEGEIEALRDVSLSLRPGEILAITGESGCGKSVLCRTVMKLIPKNAFVKGGSITAGGTDITGLGPRDMRKLRGTLFSMVFQNPMTALNPTITIGKQIEEAIRIHGRKLTAREIRDRAIHLMELTGIDHPEESYFLYPHQFSGGMRQRAAIAIALAPEPRILFADEPTTSLDAKTQIRILDLLRKIRETEKVSTVLVTHDLSAAARTADRIAVMYAGKIVEIGTSEEIFQDPRHPYTRALMRCTPSLCDGSRELRPISGSPPSLLHPPEGDSFAPRNEYALAIDFEKEPPVFSVSATHKAATWLLDPRAPEIPKRIRSDSRASGKPHSAPRKNAGESGTKSVPLIDIRNLTCRFPLPGKKSVTALDNINLQLFRGEIFGLVGESGSGKSTLARCIMNILNPSEGRIIYDGIDTCGPARHPEAKKMLQGRRSLIFQDSDASLSPRMRVEKIIAEPLQVKRPRPSSGKLRSEAEFQANAAGLSSVYLSRFSSDLSGGQRQRAAIARALITKPEFLAADEPTASLDVSIQAQIIRLFLRLQRERGFTLLFITHDLALVRCLCDRTGVMHRGRLIETAPTEELFTNPQHPYTRSLLSAAYLSDPRYEKEKR